MYILISPIVRTRTFVKEYIMSTINATSSVNAINPVVWGWGTTIEYRTDRSAGSLARHDLIEAVVNLGTGITQTSPFTVKTS